MAFNLPIRDTNPIGPTVVNAKVFLTASKRLALAVAVLQVALLVGVTL